MSDERRASVRSYVKETHVSVRKSSLLVVGRLLDLWYERHPHVTQVIEPGDGIYRG